MRRNDSHAPECEIAETGIEFRFGWRARKRRRMRSSSPLSCSTGANLPSTVSRGCASASPLPYSASSSEARRSTSRFAVCVAKRDTRIRGAPSKSVATFTSEPKGYPPLRSIVAKVPERVALSSDLATSRGAKSAGGWAFSGIRPGMAPGSGELRLASLMVPLLAKPVSFYTHDSHVDHICQPADLAPNDLEFAIESHSCCKEATFQTEFLG